MIKIMNKPWVLALLAALAVLALSTGCSAFGPDMHGKDGTPGKVIDRDKDSAYTTGSGTHKIHHPADYDLQVQPKNAGDPYWIDVGSGVYDHCYRGSSYPKCADK